MKPLFAILLSLLFYADLLHAQTGFEKVYGGNLPDWFRTVIATSDGGIIAGGGTKSYGFGDATNSDGYIVKMNAVGDTLWTRHFGEYPYNDLVNSIVENASGYLAAGYNVTDTPSTSTEYYAVQYDVNGNQLWESFYGTPGYLYCTDVITDEHGRNVLAGSSYSSLTSYDVYLVKTDAAGLKIKEAVIGTSGYDWADAIIQTSDGGYAITGYTNFGTPGYNIYLVKTDSDFNLLWEHNYGGLLDDFGYDVAEDPERNLWVLGSLETPDSRHMVLIKEDSLGENATMKFPGTSAGDFGYKIERVDSGGFLISGITATLQKANEMLVERLDANGDTLWTRHLGGSQNESGACITQDANNNILTAGETEGFGNDQFDAYLVEMDMDGDLPCPGGVSFIAPVDSVCEGQNLQFTNTTTSSQQFVWSADGNNFFNGVDANYTFGIPGTVNIALSACTTSVAKNIIVNEKPPVSFGYTVTGTTVSFTLAPDINVKSINWNFGDNTPVNTSDINPVHIYAFASEYWVIVSVTDEHGCDSTFTQQIQLATGIQDLEVQGFEIFPDPALDYIVLKCASHLSFPLNISLISMDGKVLRRETIIINGQPISTADLPAGFYFLSIKNFYGFSCMLKFARQS